MARSTPAAKAGHWLIVISTAGLPQAAGLGGPTNREEAQNLLVPDFPTPQLLLRAALPPLSQGSLSSTPTLPGWQKRKDSQEEVLTRVWAWGPIPSGLRASHLHEVHHRQWADSQRQFCGHLQVPVCFERLSEHGVHCAQWFSSVFFFFLLLLFVSEYH